MTSCLGGGLAATRRALRAGTSGLAKITFETVTLETCVGEIAGVDDARIAPALSGFDCRNNRAAAVGRAQDGFIDAVSGAVRRQGAPRIGVFIGTRTAGILQPGLAYPR